MDLDSFPRYPGGPLKKYRDGVSLDDYKAVVDWAEKTARQPAMDEALRVDLRDGSIFLKEIPQEFGEKWAGRLSRCRSDLLERYKDTRLDLLLVANRIVEYRRIHTALSLWLKGRETPRGGAPEYQIQDPEAFHMCAFCVPLDLLRGTSFEEFPDEDDLFIVQALAWFFGAAELHRSGNLKSFDLLFEVVEVLRFVSDSRAWKDAEIEERGIAASNLAKKGAAARHAQSNKKADEIKSWWKNNRGRFPSLDKAAEYASYQFDCAFRTARDHIGKVEKELRSAGKA